MKAYHIFLIRHGMTEGNRDGRYIGSTDVPMCEEGKQQIQALAEKAVYPQASLFFSSPLTRCVDTLRILYPEVRPELVPELAECSFGIYENRRFDELKDDETFRKWLAGKGQSAPSGGESGVEFQARCCRGFAALVDKLLRSGETSAVLLTHGGVIMSILSTFGLPRRPFYEWLIGNGCGFEVVVTPQLWMSGRVVEVVAMLPQGAENVLPASAIDPIRGMLPQDEGGEA